MKRTIIIFLFIVFSLFVNAQQDPFALYVEKDADWYPSIFELYIKQYADIDVNKYLIEAQSTESIKFALEEFDHITTEDISEALMAAQYGKKVFFFVETWVWGGLEVGSVYSGSWQQQMPMCSGFYVHQKKCFQNQGLNYHCGKKDNAHKTTFIIIEE